MKKTAAILLTLILALSVFCGCGTKESKTDLEYILDKGTMVIGYTVFAPIAYEENGELIGFDVDLAKAVCEKLGVKAEFQLIDWNAKEQELNAKTIDCIWNGVTMTPERKEAMLFSKPYLLNRQVVVVKGENAASYKTLADLNGKYVAAEGGSAGAEALEGADEVSEYTPVKTATQVLALTEVLSGTSDAAIIDSVMAGYYINTEGSSFTTLKIADGIAFEAEEYGIAFRKEDAKTAEAVNAAIDEFKKDGTLLEIAEKYGLADGLVK